MRILKLEIQRIWFDYATNLEYTSNFISVINALDTKPYVDLKLLSHASLHAKLNAYYIHIHPISFQVLSIFEKLYQQSFWKTWKAIASLYQTLQITLHFDVCHILCHWITANIQ